MSEDQLHTLALKVDAAFIRREDYIRTQTVLLALLPTIYGALTFVFGDDLWAGSGVYRTALQVPWSPQSWGLLFVTLGLGTIVTARRKMQRTIIGFTLTTALVLSMFMVTFLAEAIGNDAIGALPPAVVYGVFSLSFMNRARLAWAS
jgi:hypothetical protein